MTTYEKVLLTVAHHSGIDPEDLHQAVRDVLYDYAEALQREEPSAVNTIRKMMDAWHDLPGGLSEVTV